MTEQVHSMTYDPYGQQPYDPYQQQYPQDGYQQYGTYQHPPGHDPQKAPIKGPSFGKIITVIVVIIILIVVVSSAVMAFYMNQMFSSGPDTPDFPPSASLVTQDHDNPKDDITVNGGYWSARITAISGNRPYLYDVTIVISSSGVAQTRWSTVATGTVDCLQCQPPWYLKGHDPTPLFVDGSDLTSLTTTTAPQVGPNEFGTIQGAYMVYLDNDDNAKMSVDDVILVYKDPDGDGSDEVSPGNNIEINTPKGVVAKISLY